MSWGHKGLIEVWDGSAFAEPTEDQLRPYIREVTGVDFARCGTAAGAKAHSRAGEPACGPCRRGGNRAVQDAARHASSWRAAA